MKKRLLACALTILLTAGCLGSVYCEGGYFGTPLEELSQISDEQQAELSENSENVSLDEFSENEDEASKEKSFEVKLTATDRDTISDSSESASSADEDLIEDESTLEASELATDSRQFADASSRGNSKGSNADEELQYSDTEKVYVQDQQDEKIIFFDDADSTASSPSSSSTPSTVGYGRMIFTGDSRTVDMFYSDRNEIWGESHDGIPVYCRDACQSDYMINAVNSYGWENFDTLVSWMGCNDYGNFGPYEGFYNSLLAQGKQIVVCTVGPTNDSALANDFDREYYTNARQITYNSSLVSWANSKGVKVIDLYSYISGNSNLYIDGSDGIHYQPQPTSEIWYYILSALR